MVGIALVGDFEDHFDFYGCSAGEGGHADGGAGVASVQVVIAPSM